MLDFLEVEMSYYYKIIIIVNIFQISNKYCTFAGLIRLSPYETTKNYKINYKSRKRIA